MCLGIPGQVVSLESAGGLRMGKVSFGGVIREVCLEYVPEVAAGEYVIVHAGFAISRVDQEEAARTFQLLDEMGQLTELDNTDAETGSGREEPPGEKTG